MGLKPLQASRDALQGRDGNGRASSLCHRSRSPFLASAPVAPGPRRPRRGKGWGGPGSVATHFCRQGKAGGGPEGAAQFASVRRKAQGGPVAAAAHRRRDHSDRTRLAPPARLRRRLLSCCGQPHAGPARNTHAFAVRLSGARERGRHAPSRSAGPPKALYPPASTGASSVHPARAPSARDVLRSKALP